MNLVKFGDERLEKLGDNRTFVFEGEAVTSSQLNEMGRRLAGGLKSLGIGRGDHVVVSLSNSPEVFACFGTTGQPKGVMLSHNNLYQNALASWKANEAAKGDTTLICLPLAHSFGVVVMNSGNLSPFKESFGVLMRWFDPEEVFRLIEKYRVTQFIGVPTMYQILVNHPAGDKFDTSSLERCTISAAPVTEELYRSFTTKFDCQMYEGYGLTEASPAVALCRASMAIKKGSTGIPIPDVEVRIFDAEDRELPAGEQGEIVVKGPNVMLGYYKRPEETAETLRGGWLHTGDVGYLDEEGYLFITDRFKDMIIKGGYNIYPSEIEGYLEEHPAVSEIAIIGIPDDKYGEEIMAFIVRMPDQDLNEDAVIEFAKSRMTTFKAPSQVKFIDGLPKSLVGKVLKKELRKMA